MLCRTRAHDNPLFEPLSNPERIFRKKAKEDQKEIIIMAGEEQPLWNATLTAPRIPIPSIVRPIIAEEAFEIKGQFLHMVRELEFDGRRKHDPFQHLETFVEICDLFKTKGVSDDAIRLRVFPFTLIGEAKEWLKSLPAGTITTWELLKNSFIAQFFPPAKSDQLLVEITSFGQGMSESITEAWERYKTMLRSCPTHNLSKDDQIKTFYRGISESSKTGLDQSSGGIFMYNTATQAFKLLNDMATHKRNWTMNPKVTLTPGLVAKSEPSSALQAQVNDLSMKLDHLVTNVSAIFGVGTPNQAEEVNFLGNQGYGYYNNNRRPYQPNNNNGNYQQRNNGPPGFQNYNNQPNRLIQAPNHSEQASSSGKLGPITMEAMEDILRAHINENAKITTELQRSFLRLEQNQRNQQSSIQNVERNIGRIAEAFPDKTLGGLPPNTEINPRNESVNAIYTRSGIQVTPESLANHVENNGEVEEEEEIVAEQPAEEKTKDGIVVAEKATRIGEPSKAQTNETSTQIKQGLYKPKVPYPQRLAKEKLKERYAKFTDLIKQVHINVPLVDLLAGMPHYGKFMKDLISDKSLLAEVSCVRLGEDCSEAITKMPPKLGDTGSFTIPCFIGETHLCNALADLGASINLMPMSLFTKLGLEELKATKMGIQLADRSVKYPLGIAENIPVKVDKFVFPVDFVVLDIKEDDKVPIILGRPFLNTADAVIHVNKKTLTLGVGNDKIAFNVDKVLMQPSMFDDSCYSVDTIDDCVKESLRLTPR